MIGPWKCLLFFYADVCATLIESKDGTFVRQANLCLEINQRSLWFPKNVFMRQNVFLNSSGLIKLSLLCPSLKTMTIPHGCAFITGWMFIAVVKSTCYNLGHRNPFVFSVPNVNKQWWRTPEVLTKQSWSTQRSTKFINLGKQAFDISEAFWLTQFVQNC